jgi:hypothetical protein
VRSPNLWEVVNVIDENLDPGEGGLRRPGVFDGKRNLARLMAPRGVDGINNATRLDVSKALNRF